MKTILVMAATADGKIARNSSHLVDWTGRRDKQLFVRLTREAGVMVMGSKTYQTIGRPLPGRKNVVLTRDPAKFSNEPDLFFTDQRPERIIADLEGQGVESVALIGGAEVNSLFLRDRLIDEIYLTIVPKIFGTGLSMFSEAADFSLKLLGSSELDEDSILIRYKMIYPEQESR